MQKDGLQIVQKLAGGALDFLVVSPAGTPAVAPAIAAARAGAIGALDLQFAHDDAGAELVRLCELGRGRCAAVVDAGGESADALVAAPPIGLHAVVLAGGQGLRLKCLVGAAQVAGLAAFTVASSVDEALAGEAAGADAVIAKGHEAGGWVGDDGSFVLLQACVAALGVPVWAHGGVGIHTVAACRVAGAAGAVLDAQMLLARESPLDAATRSRLEGMDGSETVCLGPPGGHAGLRVFSRPGLDAVDALKRLATGDANAWRAAARGCVDWRDRPGAVLAVGQDAAFAAGLAKRFKTVGGILDGLRAAVDEQVRAARNAEPLAEGAALAASHGTRYPIAQGPMTRVSDRAPFAAAVAEAGALPFLALALMRGPEATQVLAETKALLADRPWGVGILGFVPADLRAEQLKAIRVHRPPFALIAGGRPDQARALEDDGIATYLHVPSPGLLRLYLADGARRFVFEGRECGGHVGPRTSFVLWDTMVRVLLDELPADGDGCHVLLAGGIHDGASAAMAAAAAAPLAQRGVRVGVLMGTAYVFTDEAVASGAITQRFQQAAVEGVRTVLLETGPGHATRCLPSPFVDEFHAEQRRLRAVDAAPEEERARLELLNIGRLRVAAKGADRAPDAEERRLIDVDAQEQWARGMYMIGQVAALRERPVTLAELHEDVTAGSTRRLDAVEVPAIPSEPAPPPADVAIIGIGCILPGAADVETFWSNVIGGVDAVGEVPPARWDWRRYFDADRSAPDKIYSRWGGFVDDVEFDPVAFGMPPNSLHSIEPFQLFGLLVARAALRDAGYAERPFPRDRTAVVLGAGGGGADLAVGYMARSAMPALMDDPSGGVEGAIFQRLPEWTEDSFAGLLMNVSAGRIANRLDLKGPNFTVDAACGSSLAAVHLAVRDLQLGTSDMAVAGGVDAIQNPFSYLCFSKTHALSPTGRCRPFDADADGIAISEGFAAVVLKRLADAERDGDRIYAVVRGVGSASDGRDRTLTAPRPEGQMRALRRAYAHAGCSPATVGLVEAHGTGTVAGDRAEVASLTAVYRDAGAARQACAIGSVKSMIGHTKATAGVAGLIKASLALHHRVLPPTLGVKTPNPAANFSASPFYVNSEARPWIRGAQPHPRRAAVSAFGFGGTDWHAVLEEYDGGFLPDGQVTMDAWPAELYLWRGASRAEIADEVAALVGALARTEAPPSPADLALTLALRAAAVDGAACTLALVATSVDDLAGKLAVAQALLASEAQRRHGAGGIHFAQSPLAADGRVALLFPGQGSQHVGMARELAVVFPEVRSAFDRADGVLAGRHEQPLSRYVFPPPTFDPEEEREQQAALTDTHVAQPALGATELGVLHVLRELGVEPELVAGHSYGEFVALCAAGVLAEDDLLRLSEARGRFIREEASEESGAMAAVDAGPDILAPLLECSAIVLANLNAPLQTVVSGSRADIERALAWCKERDLRARKLPVACAFHSPLVAPAERRLAEELRSTPMTAPRMPVFSNTTADLHPAAPDAIAALLAEHLTRPVAFSRELEAMHEAGARLFVEPGPRNVLTGLVTKTLGDRPHLAVAVDEPGQPGLPALLDALAALAAEGVPIRAQRLFRGRSARRLDPSTLEPAEGRPARSAATWLVNGGRARPADLPADPIPDPVPLRLDSAIMNPALAPPTNGHHDIEVLPPPAPADDRASDVMGRYQQVMQQFLDTERAVMLAYLRAPGAADPAVRHRPAEPLPAALPGANGHGPAQTAVASAPLAAPALRPPAAAAPAAAAAPVAPAAPAGLSGDGIRARLLEVVSERTGYPPEMLELDADLEADLGVDSIKRVEIAGTIVQELQLPEGAELDVEEMTANRTLRQVLAVLERLTEGDAVAEGDDRRPFVPAPDDERIVRHLLRVAEAPSVAAPRGGLAAGGVVLIVDDAAGVSEAVAAQLAGHGHRAVRLPAGADDGADVARRLGEVAGAHGPASALVHLGGLDHGGVNLEEMLALLQHLRGDLEAAATSGGAAVLGATRLGGAFGAGGLPEAARPADGALAGFLKTLALEWPSVRVKALDLAAGTPDELAEHVVAELLAADGLVEVGHRDDGRVRLELVPAAVRETGAPLPLDEDSVVLLTGGARGITAEVAVALAASARCTLVLVGRTPASEPDVELDALEDPRELRRAVIARRRAAGAEVTPGAVEHEVRRLSTAREVRRTLARLRATGARVEHRTCDVGDADAFGGLIDGVYARHGRLDGVIHGAGLIEDKLIRDKTPDSLARVLAAKAGSARTLAERLRPDGLRFLVLFSSVSARFGNRGQGDYAAASEVLNKLAQDLDRRWPARIVAINWGPWRAAGMVSPEVQGQFEARGVPLIDVAAGCKALVDELRLGTKGEAEVLIGAAPLPPLLAAAGELSVRDRRVELVRALDPEHDLYLADHRLDGRPVLPFAVAMELMAETAAAARPALQDAELADIRLLKGVTVGDAIPRVRVVAEPAAEDGSTSVTVASLDGDRLHYRALVRPAGVCAPAPAPLADPAPYPGSVDDAYRDLLFHGPLFHGIEAIEGMDEGGASARLRPSLPAACLRVGGPGGTWLIDPVLVDSAFQVQLLWARLHWDVTLLPAGVGAARVMTADAAHMPWVRHELRIRPDNRAPMCRADHWFLAPDGRVLGSLTDAHGAGSRALNRLVGAAR